MIALDTNILVRFLVEDDAEQTRLATRVLEHALESGEPCYVSDVVMCEIVWVLDARYKIRRTEIHHALERLLQSQQLVFTSSSVLARALHAFAKGRGDFADYLIREHARAAGCEIVVTFDGKLLKEAGFRGP